MAFGTPATEIGTASQNASGNQTIVTTSATAAADTLVIVWIAFFVFEHIIFHFLDH